MSKLSQINLFDYLDYREFLRDWYAYHKKHQRGFSYRSFSQQAGFSSPNFFKLVENGQRNLTEASLTKFVKGLKLNKQEIEFFRNLVFYGQAPDHEKKNHYYSKLIKSRKFTELKPIEKNQYAFYSTWYHPVVRELVISKGFDGSTQWIANRIQPSLTLNQIEKSIELLEELGFIKKNKENRWEQSRPLTTTGNEATEMAVLNYHQSLLKLSFHLLPQIEQDERDVSALILGVSKSKVSELKNKIQEFRKEILKFISDDNEPEEVIMLAMQMLPVTKKPTKE